MLDKEHRGTEAPRRKGDGSVTVYGGFQCDEMGLGKTIQMVSVMAHHALPVTLLLAPLAMLDTWKSVCVRAGFVVYEAVKGEWAWAAGKGDVAKNGYRVEVYLTNLEKLYTTPRLFRGHSFDRVVVDEAHRLCNGDSEMARAARRVHAPIRWAMTGTPLVNRLADVVSLLAFLGVPHSPLWRWDKERYETLLPSLLLHRTMESVRNVIQGAPPVPRIHHWKLPFCNEKERAFYTGAQSKVIQEGGRSPSAVNMFLLLLRLRQLAVHPQIYIRAMRRESRSYAHPDWKEPSTKMLALRKIIERDRKAKQEEKAEEKEVHRYLVFCHFQDEMALLRDDLITSGGFSSEHVLMYHGSLTKAQRESVLTVSKASTEPTVLLLQLQAGGVGLNLQEYDRIVFVSPWWTSALMVQAVARAVRMGQTRVVEVYHLELDLEKGADADAEGNEQKDIILIDRLVRQKADTKRELLQWLFALCDGKEEKRRS